MRRLLLTVVVSVLFAVPAVAQSVEQPVIISETPAQDRVSTRGLLPRDNVWVLAGSAALAAVVIALVADSDS